MSDVTVTKISGGKHHLIILDKNGRVQSWVLNDKSQLGHTNDLIIIAYCN